MSRTNVIRVGVTDFYVAKATETIAAGVSTVTYATPAVVGGTASVSVSQQSGENKVYESDVLIRNKNRISGATLSYKSRTVSLEDEMDLLYSQTAEEGSAFEDGPDDSARNVAVGFAAKQSDGSYKCMWYYWATGSKGDESYETATDSESSPEDEYKFNCMPSPSTGKLRRRKICATEADKNTFFAAVIPAPAPVQTDPDEGETP